MKFLLSLLLISSSALALDEVIQVQGRCEIKVAPDRGRVTFTAENLSQNQTEAFNKTTAQIEALKAEIKKLNLKDSEMKTSGYQVYPVREYVKDKMIDRGTRVSLSLDVESSEFNRLGTTLLIASRQGIANVGSLTLFLSLEKSRAEYTKCLALATEDARSKAQSLAKNLGVKAGRVVRVVELGSPQTPVFHAKEMMSLRDEKGGSAPSIEPGTELFSTSLEVSFAL